MLMQHTISPVVSVRYFRCSPFEGNYSRWQRNRTAVAARTPIGRRQKLLNTIFIYTHTRQTKYKLFWILNRCCSLALSVGPLKYPDTTIQSAYLFIGVSTFHTYYADAGWCGFECIFELIESYYDIPLYNGMGGGLISATEGLLYCPMSWRWHIFLRDYHAYNLSSVLAVLAGSAESTRLSVSMTSSVASFSASAISSLTVV